MHPKAESNIHSFRSKGPEELNLTSSPLKMEIDSAFSPDILGLSCPSTCSSSTTGSFSSSSSFQEPYTPTRNSTPHQSMDYDCSFASSSLNSSFGSSFSSVANDTMNFGVPTPASSMSDFFSMDKTSGLFNTAPPMTPTRYDHMLGSNLALHGSSMDFNATSGLDMYNFGDVVDSSPFMLATPDHSFNSNATSYDMSSIWMQNTDSPITFQDRQPSPCDMSMSSYMTYGHRRDIAMSDVQQTSAALHRAQKSTSSRHRITKSKHTSAKLERLAKGGVSVSTAAKARYICTEEACNRKGFKRQEHLKRHTQTVHKPGAPKYICEHCDVEISKRKVFNRKDNFTQHLVLHCTDKNGRRTNYAPAARIHLDAIHKGMKNRRKPAGPTKVEKTENTNKAHVKMDNDTFYTPLRQKEVKSEESDSHFDHEHDEYECQAHSS